MTDVFVPYERHPACGVCPARRFPIGEFDVAERPSRDSPFSPEDGHRYTADGVSVCVHPDKVGIPAARYKSDGISQRTDLVLPDRLDELAGYLRDVMHGAAPGILEALIEKATTEIPRTFPGIDVTETLRRALN